jgi:CRP-like cAMP-binding protein
VVERQLPRVLHIIRNNRRILFQREIGTDLVADIAGTFKLTNDPVEARCYCNLICNFLYNSNRIDLDTRDMLNLALYEMLMNAIEHGNCGITYEEKTAWLEADGAVVDLIEARCQDARLAQRQVTVEYAIESDGTTFLIADEGDGFNWRAVQDATDEKNLFKQHGRGILMASSLARNLEYNEKGNEVRFEFPHPVEVAVLTPGLLQHIPPRRVEAGEVIFHQGERGNDLYYIAKGHYEVLVNDQVVSTMSPEDIFMGEMSFLLDNQRSATVRARTEGTLVGISKKDFIEAIKKKPHYALFLSRLLAQRIQRANLKSVGQRSSS